MNIIYLMVYLKIDTEKKPKTIVYLKVKKLAGQ